MMDHYWITMGDLMVSKHAVILILGQAKLFVRFPFQDIQKMIQAGGYYSLFIIFSKYIFKSILK